ncbi:MAG: hypothetical protein QOG95_4393 [Mycobacterium sp.]|nr:hypothetical protein [Mycobacterium sp.]
MAIVLGGSTEPTPSLSFAQAAENVYLQRSVSTMARPTRRLRHDWDRSVLRALQVLTTPELIQQGPSSFTAADDVTLAVETEFNANPGAFDAGHPLTIFGYSQSATAESIAMTQINAYSMAHGDSIPLDDLHFVFIGDPSLADTGVWSNLLLDLDSILGTTLTNTILTDAGFDAVLGNVTPDDLYPTTIYSLDGDGVAQFQQDFESGGLLGTIEGLFLQHVEYLGLTPEELALATTTTQGDLTPADIPDTFNNADAWLSAVFENGAAGSGVIPWSAWADRISRVKAISISVTVAMLGVARIPSFGERTGGYRRWTLLHHRWSPVACCRPIDSRGSPDRARPNTDGVAARGSPHQGNTAGVGSPSGCAGRKSGFGGARLAAVVGADRRATPHSVAGSGFRAELAGEHGRPRECAYSHAVPRPSDQQHARTNQQRFPGRGARANVGRRNLEHQS